MSDCLISLEGVSKYYNGIPALVDVDFRCNAGEIHAILGENGAGKSTLMKLMAGVIRPSAGHIRVGDREMSFASPRDAAREGIVCMFQELSLMPHLTVGDNLFLAAGRGTARRRVLAEAREILNRVGGARISLSALVQQLALAERQIVEIAKALLRRPRLLILDEATSALTSDLVEVVFGAIRELRDQGVAVLFISHRMYEVDAIADRISVFRNGRHIETFPAGEKDHDEIIRLMIGQSLKQLFPPPRAPVPDTIAPLLSVRGLSWAGQLRAIDLDVRPGEIVGLGGLDGQGQQQVLHALFGVLNGVEGSISVAGQSLKHHAPNTAKSERVGIALVPEDRKTDALVLDMSIEDNLRLPGLGRVPAGLMARAGSLDARLSRLIGQLSLSYGDLGDAVGTLSGGNQQKVVLAQWLALSPRCLLLMDPTRGIDVKTKSEIYALLSELADQGLAIVLQSTDYEELIHLCDRVHVLYHGAVNRTLSGPDLNAETLIAASMNLAPAQGAN